jgi:alpha-ketoglutaric semialdehyde dehydrogenase
MILTGKQLIGNSESVISEETFNAVNPVTAEVLEPPFVEGRLREVHSAMALARTAADEMRHYSAEKLAGLCDKIAERLEANKDALLDRCRLECGYPDGRLNGEFGRTVGQLRQFATIAREGRWLDARIDHANPDRVPAPKPDVRAMMIPLGPVAVFGASNFPLALSCAGGDTASALAAGCPVVVKGHPSHPGTCEIAARAILEAVKECGFPEGTFSLIQGTTHEIGGALVEHPDTAAVGFTGSLRAGQALFDIGAARPNPIPVYAEMGSINPQFIYPGKLSNPAAFAEALFGSVTLGNGQFCTNPGIVFVPEGADTDAFLGKYRELVAAADPAPMLNKGILNSFSDGLDNLESFNIDVVRGKECEVGFKTSPALATLTLAQFEENRLVIEEEIFGPSTVVVVCPSIDNYAAIARNFSGQLATSIHGSDEDLAKAQGLVDVLTLYAGRICVNGFPTGIEICHAMHHGGPFPASTDAHFTSIGLSAIARWGRPVTFQDVPDILLPDALKESNPLGIKRLVDGE